MRITIDIDQTPTQELPAIADDGFTGRKRGLVAPPPKESVPDPTVTIESERIGTARLIESLRASNEVFARQANEWRVSAEKHLTEVERLETKLAEMHESHGQLQQDREYWKDTAFSNKAECEKLAVELTKAQNEIERLRDAFYYSTKNQGEYVTFSAIETSLDKFFWGLVIRDGRTGKVWLHDSAKAYILSLIKDAAKEPLCDPSKP